MRTAPSLTGRALVQPEHAHAVRGRLDAVHGLAGREVGQLAADGDRFDGEGRLRLADDDDEAAAVVMEEGAGVTRRSSTRTARRTPAASARAS
jgi:hypothetical protein